MTRTEMVRARYILPSLTFSVSCKSVKYSTRNGSAILRSTLSLIIKFEKGDYRWYVNYIQYSQTRDSSRNVTERRGASCNHRYLSIISNVYKCTEYSVSFVRQIL